MEAAFNKALGKESEGTDMAAPVTQDLVLHSSANTETALQAYGSTSDQKIMANPVAKMHKNYAESYTDMIAQSIEQVASNIALTQA